MDARVQKERSSDKPLILIIVKRAAIFLSVVCAVSIFYWIVGSESSFLDETQSMLLDIMRISSLGLIVSSGMGILLSLAAAIARRYRLKAGIIGYAVAAALGGAALALAESISILAKGLH
jgi:hypothetical protein